MIEKMLTKIEAYIDACIAKAKAKIVQIGKIFKK